MTTLTRIGASGFLLWGALHIVGGGAILAALTGGPAAGYALYRGADGPFPAVAGAILGYFAFFLVLTGAAVAVIALRRNWANDAAGLALNTGIVLATELGLVWFLLIPGHLSFGDAAPGFALFAIGAIFGGLACRGGHHETATG